MVIAWIFCCWYLKSLNINFLPWNLYKPTEPCPKNFWTAEKNVLWTYEKFLKRNVGLNNNTLWPTHEPKPHVASSFVYVKYGKAVCHRLEIAT